jgi:hypothetical protein
MLREYEGVLPHVEYINVVLGGLAKRKLVNEVDHLFHLLGFSFSPLCILPKIILAVKRTEKYFGCKIHSKYTKKYFGCKYSIFILTSLPGEKKFGDFLPVLFSLFSLSPLPLSSLSLSLSPPPLFLSKNLHLNPFFQDAESVKIVLRGYCDVSTEGKMLGVCLYLPLFPFKGKEKRVQKKIILANLH